MPNLLLDEDFRTLKQSLPAVFRAQIQNKEAVLAQAYPLLNMICKDREVIARLQASLNVPALLPNQELATQIEPLCQELDDKFNHDTLFQYRLPIILSEFPIHSRAINQAIHAFNEIIEAHHQGLDAPISDGRLENCYKTILAAIKEHGSYCDNDSLLQLFGMMAGWSRTYPIALLKKVNQQKDDQPQEPIQAAIPQKEWERNPVDVVEREHPVKPFNQNPFIPDYNYNLNGAGRLASETDILLLNAFGMKIGGHFDAQVKYPPRFIPLEQLHALIRRQLSHRIQVWPTESFQLWLEVTLHQLGVVFIQKNTSDLSRDLLVNPFFTDPISFLSPEKILSILKATLADYTSEELNPTKTELEILSQYLFDLLQGFQVNPGQALGIGANWDGTVNLSNEAGTYAFKFRETEAEWGRRFKQLSLHRQGPSEARMNAAIGLKFELQSLLTSFDYMNQLQPSEYPEVLSNAIIDNLVTDLFPDPAYFENAVYQKFRKQHVARRNEEGIIQIDSFLQASNQGTYFKDREGNDKQTPMYRRAGTLDVQAFPKNSTYSEQSKVCYAGNPLGPLQLQYAQAMFKTARGHVVYDPIGPDQFLEDAFYGQVLRGENGDYLPFIGVVPKNFDRHFNQPKELCASFVIRMLQSARLMEHSPTFRATYEQIKTRFLPVKEIPPPSLPKFCADYLVEQHHKLATALTSNERSFSDCEKKFYSLFKNLIYSLYDLGRGDEHFKHGFLSFINSADTFYPVSKARCEKIIRDLTVNRPVTVSPESVARYDEILACLKETTTYFYPAPSDSVAQEIARQAKLHVRPLLQSEGINAYFNAQRQNRQENLSRKQTPGMLFAALKHDGPSKSIARDYGEMHDRNFPSYYRDPDGTATGEPQTNDRFIDWSAKHLGAGLQVMHKYQPLGLIRRPFTETYIHARERAAEHQYDTLKPLWALEGAIEGLFWHGIIMGLWYTTTSPFQMIGDFFSWQYENLKRKKIAPKNNPLALPAAPANDPGIKTQVSANSRDYLLQLLRKPGGNDIKKTEAITYCTQLLKKLYPYLTKEDLRLCFQKLQNTFPLSEEEWRTLFQPLVSPVHVGLSALFQRYNAYINNNLVQAVYRCITHPLFLTQTNTIIKETQTFFSLNSKQNEVLAEILKLYRSSSAVNKHKFIQLFSFNGEIQNTLQIRDQLLQKIQSYILKVFDEQWILELLFDAHIDVHTLRLTLLTLENTISRLPDSMKWPLTQLLATNNLKVLDDYVLTDKQVAFLLKTLMVFSLITEQSNKERLLLLCRVNKKPDEKLLSVKDKAHNKWAQFAERELKHQLLSLAEANDIFALLAEQLKKPLDLKLLIDQLQQIYQSLTVDNDQSLKYFYETVNAIQNRLAQFLQLKKPTDIRGYTEAQNLLDNFVNITMNAVINSRLDNGNIFDMEPPHNPLISSKPIESWLTGLQNNNRDLRALLEQQVQQAPSLDHSLWRCKCILQVLEQRKPTEKIAKTGMQSLLRFWSQHKDNVTLAGESYTNPETGEINKSTYPVLIQNSATLEHAMTRVRQKLPKLSLFSLSRKIEEGSIDSGVNSESHTPPIIRGA